MTSIVRRPLYRFRLAGSTVALAADPVQNEALEGVITRAVQVELKDEPVITDGMSAKISLIEREASTITEQFSGFVGNRRGVSFPHSVVIPCVGPLSRLRRVPTHDHTLTGMTDGEAVMHILDACNIDYDAGDIQDAGYVLGAVEPVYWLTDQPGHELIREIDSLFGMATVETGAGRVARFAYDRAPSSALISATYQRGVDAEFWGDERARGDLDRIQNVWKVNGLSWHDDVSGCQMSVWARGDADNDALGAGVRNQSQPFQSDLIQDSGLAKAIATRLMRWYNRLPDELTVRALNDPAVVPGSVIGVKDAIYGIDLTASAASTPYLVLTVDRRGDEMTLGCIGGAAGDTGTITGGVEKTCNQTAVGTLDSPPLFSPPTISVPPVPATDPFSEGGGGGDPFCLTAESPASWVNADTNSPGVDWTISGSSLTAPAGNSVAYSNESIPRIGGLPVSYTVTFAVNSHNGILQMYACDNDALDPLHWIFWYSPGFGHGIELYDWNAWNGGGNLPADFGNATIDTWADIEIAWNRPSHSLSLTVDGVTQTISGAEDGDAAGLFLTVISDTISGGYVEISNVVISIDEDASGASCAGGIDLAAALSGWEEVNPDFTAVTGDLTFSGQGSARNTQLELQDQSWTMTLTGHATSADSELTFGMAAAAGSAPFVGVRIYEQSSGFPEAIELFGDSGSVFGTGTKFTASVDIDITLAFDNTTGDVSVTATQGALSYTLSQTEPLPYGFTTPYLAFLMAEGTANPGDGIEVSQFLVEVT